MSSDKLVLYVYQASSYSHRALIAAKEAGIDLDIQWVDLLSKPDWYASKVNPRGEVPAIAYTSNPTSPSPTDFKLAQSRVITEYFAELNPESNLLPSSPRDRAQIRFIFDHIDRFFLPAFFAFLGGQPNGKAELLKEIESIQDLLQKTNGPWFAGEHFTLADVALAPFVTRLDFLLKEGIGKFKLSEGKDLEKLLAEDEKYKVYKQYSQAIWARDSVKSGWYGDYVVARQTAKLGKATD